MDFAYVFGCLSQVAFLVTKKKIKELLETELPLKSFLRANKQEINHLINKHVLQAFNKNNKRMLKGKNVPAKMLQSAPKAMQRGIEKHHKKDQRRQHIKYA